MRRGEHTAMIAMIVVLFVVWLVLTSVADSKPVSWGFSVASVYDADGLGGDLACGRTARENRRGQLMGYFVAHKTLPCGTKVRFLYRGRKVTARVRDRGPYVGGREWDLDMSVQRRLGFPWGVDAVRWRLIR